MLCINEDYLCILDEKFGWTRLSLITILQIIQCCTEYYSNSLLSYWGKYEKNQFTINIKNNVLYPDFY